MSPGVGLQMDMGLLFYHKVPWKWEETQLHALSCVCVCVCVCVCLCLCVYERERGVWTLDVLHRRLAPLTLDSFTLSDSPGDVPLKSSLGPPGKARSHFPESHAAGEAVQARVWGWVAGISLPGDSSLRPAPST